VKLRRLGGRIEKKIDNKDKERISTEESGKGFQDFLS